MNHGIKYNNYTVYSLNEKSPKKINAFLIDIKKRELYEIKVSETVESFTTNNNFFKYTIYEINSVNKKGKKQIAIYSVDEDLKNINKPFKLNNIEIFSNCLICSSLQSKEDLRDLILTEYEIREMIEL